MHLSGPWRPSLKMAAMPYTLLDIFQIMRPTLENVVSKYMFLGVNN